jgi:hypothetical protein
MYEAMYEFAVENYLLKLQRLQNKVLRTIGNFPRRTSVRDLYMAFKLPYIYICMCVIIQQNYAGNKQKSCKIMKMLMFATFDKTKRDTANIRSLNLAAVKHQTVQVTKFLL